MNGVAAVILAAGTSSRFRAADASVPTKLVADLDGLPLVRRVAVAALASRARPVLVVTGHAAAEVRKALSELDVAIAHNARYLEGLSSSLKAGLAALPADSAGALILLGDMPGIGPSLLDRLIDDFALAPGFDAVVPVRAGRRGNPALLGRALFDAAANLSGDEGARGLLRDARVLEIEVAEDGVAIDVDDPEMLLRLRGRFG